MDPPCKYTNHTNKNLPNISNFTLSMCPCAHTRQTHLLNQHDMLLQNFCHLVVVIAYLLLLSILFLVLVQVILFSESCYYLAVFFVWLIKLGLLAFVYICFMYYTLHNIPDFPFIPKDKVSFVLGLTQKRDVWWYMVVSIHSVIFVKKNKFYSLFNT